MTVTDTSIHSPVEPAQASRPFDWYRTLSGKGRRAFIGAFGGYGLDSYDFQVLPLALGAIAAYFGLGTGQAGLLTTVTLVVSALGGALAGVLVDKIGRVRTLQITVATYAVFTVLCGFAPNYETLLVFRAFQGLGFGGEWAAGAILVAEYARAKYRGRAVAFVQSSWAVGWGLAVIVYTIVFQLFDEDVAWRVMFLTGALPALLIVWVRRNLTDTEAVTEKRESAGAERGSFAAIFSMRLLRTTFFASLLATGVQGGYYTLASWLPTYLKTCARPERRRHRRLPVPVLICGAFLGYVTGGYLTDRLGRKRNMQLFAVLSAVFMVAYTQVPEGANTLVLVLGFPLGFCTSAIFSGIRLVPLRAVPDGSSAAPGRASPTTPAARSARSSRRWSGSSPDQLGVGGAMMFGRVGYGIAALALLGLPETRGRELA